MKPGQRKRQFWQEQMDQWVASGVGQRRFCEEQELSFSSFSYWRQQLRREATEMAEAPSNFNKSVNSFVPVHVMAGAQTSSHQASHRLRSPDGWEIIFSQQTPIESIAKLLSQFLT